MANAIVERPRTSPVGLLKAPQQRTPIPETFLREFSADSGQVVPSTPPDPRTDAEITTDYIKTRRRLNKSMYDPHYGESQGALMHEVWLTAKTMRGRGMDVPSVPYNGPGAISMKDRQNYRFIHPIGSPMPNDFGRGLPDQGGHIDRMKSSFEGFEFRVENKEGEQAVVDVGSLIAASGEPTIGDSAPDAKTKVKIYPTGEKTESESAYPWKDAVEEGLVWRYKTSLHEMTQLRQLRGPRTQEQEDSFRAAFRKSSAMKKVIDRKGIDLTRM